MNAMSMSTRVIRINPPQRVYAAYPVYGNAMTVARAIGEDAPSHGTSGAQDRCQPSNGTNVHAVRAADDTRQNGGD